MSRDTGVANIYIFKKKKKENSLIYDHFPTKTKKNRMPQNSHGVITKKYNHNS
jgi:hypothetical protein